MPIIPASAARRTERHALAALDHEVHERLKQYAEFIQSPKDYVIGQALRRLFRKDKDFAAGSSPTRTERSWREIEMPGTAVGSPARTQRVRV